MDYFPRHGGHGYGGDVGSRGGDVGGGGQHLRQEARGVGHNIVREDDGERFVAHGIPGHQHGVSQPQGLFLDHKGYIGQSGSGAGFGEQKAVGGQPPFQVGTGLKIVGDALFARGGDNDYFRDAGFRGLGDDVLEHRAVEDGQEFFRHRAGNGQEARSQPGGGYYGLTNSNGGGHRGNDSTARR